MGERAQAETAERVGHTPGPWAAGLSHGRGVLCVTANDGCTWICGELLNDHEPIAGTEAKANARLIAAAPDLYEALRLSLPLLEAANAKCTNDTAFIAVVRAAIAKAEGR